MEKFTPLTKFLHCCRQWRHWQIPPLKMAYGYISGGCIFGCSQRLIYLCLEFYRYMVLVIIGAEDYPEYKPALRPSWSETELRFNISWVTPSPQNLALEILKLLGFVIARHKIYLWMLDIYSRTRIPPPLSLIATRQGNLIFLLLVHTFLKIYTCTCLFQEEAHALAKFSLPLQMHSKGPKWALNALVYSPQSQDWQGHRRGERHEANLTFFRFLSVTFTNVSFRWWAFFD